MWAVESISQLLYQIEIKKGNMLNANKEQELGTMESVVDAYSLVFLWRSKNEKFHCELGHPGGYMALKQTGQTQARHLPPY